MSGEILQLLIGAVFVLIGSLIFIRLFRALAGDTAWMKDRSPEEEYREQKKRRRWRW